MKRIISLILCVVIAMLALVSCEENISEESKKEQDRIEGLYDPVVLPDVSLTLYIISDGYVDENHNAVDNTVKDKIQLYLNERANKKFNTTLDIKYYEADEYESAVENLESGIVLITGEYMLEDGYFANAELADLNGYLTDSALIKKYGFATLNASFKKTNPYLLAASRDYLEDGTEELRFIPNNRVMGSYSYILIDKNVVCDELNYNEAELKDIDTLAEVDALKAELATVFAANSSIFGDLIVDEVVRVVEGKSYEARETYNVEGYICNILEYPVITKSEAAESGFAVLRDKDIVVDKKLADMSADEKAAYEDYLNYEACAMEVIYLLNSDKTVRNLLLYGVETIHYDIKNGVVVPKQITGDRKYKMSLEYTGDIFLALFCEDSDRDVWTEEMMNSGLKQNLESHLPSAE